MKAKETEVKFFVTAEIVSEEKIAVRDNLFAFFVCNPSSR